MSYTVHQAKTNLSRLIKEAEKGTEVVITRGKKPVAKLVPIASTAKSYTRQVKGQIWSAPDALIPSPTRKCASWVLNDRATGHTYFAVVAGRLGSIITNGARRRAIDSTLNSMVISVVVPWELAVETNTGKLSSELLLSRWKEILDARVSANCPSSQRTRFVRGCCLDGQVAFSLDPLIDGHASASDVRVTVVLVDDRLEGLMSTTGPRSARP